MECQPILLKTKSTDLFFYANAGKYKPIKQNSVEYSFISEKNQIEECLQKMTEMGSYCDTTDIKAQLTEALVILKSNESTSPTNTEASNDTTETSTTGSNSGTQQETMTYETEQDKILLDIGGVQVTQSQAETQAEDLLKNYTDESTIKDAKDVYNAVNSDNYKEELQKIAEQKADAYLQKFEEYNKIKEIYNTYVVKDPEEELKKIQDGKDANDKEITQKEIVLLIKLAITNPKSAMEIVKNKALVEAEAKKVELVNEAKNKLIKEVTDKLKINEKLLQDMSVDRYVPEIKTLI